MSSAACGIDGLEAVFDDVSLVSGGGLLLAATVMDRLGSGALIDDTVRPPAAGRGSGCKVLSLVASMLVGVCCIDDADRLRAGSAHAVLGFGVAAPSTLGTFLRSFAFGHVRQLDKAQELALGRAWSVMEEPVPEAGLTVDLDSTVVEVHGRAKQGAAYGHTKVLGYHPLVAVRCDTGEIVHSSMREGSSQRGHRQFAVEALGRVRLAAAVWDCACARMGGSSVMRRSTRWSPTTCRIRSRSPKTPTSKQLSTRSPRNPHRTLTAHSAAWPKSLRPPTAPPARPKRAAPVAPGGSPHPPHRPPTRTVARLAVPRLGHQPFRPRRPSRRRLPPSPRHSRARHQRPQRPIRALALRLRGLLGGRRLARQPSGRPQHRPLGWAHRQNPADRTTHRDSHPTHPAVRGGRPSRQPQPPIPPAPTRQLAPGQNIHHRPTTNPQPPNSSNHPPHQRPRSAQTPRPPTPPTPTPNTNQPNTPQHAPHPHTAPTHRTQPPNNPTPNPHRWIQA